MDAISQQMKIVELNTEIAELKRQSTIQQKHIKELEREIADYTQREKELLTEINDLNEQLAMYDVRTPIPVQIGANGADIVNPKLPFGFHSGDTSDSTGLENTWEDVMYAFTDEIFLQANTPDLLLYRDDERAQYISTTGKTILAFPITQEQLLYFNIVGVRPLTLEEIKLLEQEASTPPYK